MSKEELLKKKNEMGWYGDWLSVDAKFINSEDDPYVQSVVKIIKEKVLGSLSKRCFNVLQEQVVIKQPYEGITATIAWKAHIQFKDEIPK